MRVGARNNANAQGIQPWTGSWNLFRIGFDLGVIQNSLSLLAHTLLRADLDVTD